MPLNRTPILALLLLLTGICAAVGWWRMDTQRDGALAAENDLSVVQRDLSDITQTRTAGGARQALARMDTSDLSRRVSDAATVAGVAEKFSGVEWNTPQPVPGATDYSELPAFLDFPSISMRQLTLLLHHLAATDPTSRAKSIELHLADKTVAGATDGDLWTADVTVNFLLYSPKDAKAR